MSGIEKEYQHRKIDCNNDCLNCELFNAEPPCEIVKELEPERSELKTVKYIVVKCDGSNAVLVVTEDNLQELKQAMIALNGYSEEDWFACIVGEIVKDTYSNGVS